MPFPLATLAASVTPAGITAPAYADILSSLQASFRLIYGVDVYLGADTQDGQLLAVFAQAVYDSNQTAIAVYNQFSPATAQGAGLSSVVRINGIRRLVSSNSQVDLLIGGNVGTVITNGVAGDANGKAWALPASVTIPPAGSIVVTAACTVPGAVPANVGTVTSINTPTLGWQTVTNPSAASLGSPVEDDATLRVRQGQSVALPALTVLAATVGAVKAIVGVTEVKAYENDTGAPDANGLPHNSIALVVVGGDATAVATAIMVKKTPGCFTHGTTYVPVVDTVGVTHNIGFFVPTNVPIAVQATIRALAGYTAATGATIKQAIADYINNVLGIGDPVFISRLYLPAQLGGAAASGQYELLSLLIGTPPGINSASDIAIPFSAQATCAVADIGLTVV